MTARCRTCVLVLLLTSLLASSGCLVAWGHQPHHLLLQTQPAAPAPLASSNLVQPQLSKCAAVYSASGRQCSCMCMQRLPARTVQATTATCCPAVSPFCLFVLQPCCKSSGQPPPDSQLCKLVDMGSSSCKRSRMKQQCQLTAGAGNSSSPTSGGGCRALTKRLY